MAEVIAVFPLHHVLLPGLPLPLHIFEPRYQQLLDDVRTGDGPGSFGVVALRSGDEISAGALTRDARDAAAAAAAADGAEDQPIEDVAEIGTLAEIIEIEAGGGGTRDLLTVGSRRFRIVRLVGGAAYLRAEVEWMDEDIGELHVSHVQIARKLNADLRALLAALTGRSGVDELPDDPTLLSYHLAGHSPLTPRDRQALLAEPTTARRLRHVIAVLRREITLIEHTRSVAIAPSVLRLPVEPN